MCFVLTPCLGACSFSLALGFLRSRVGTSAQPLSSQTAVAVRAPPWAPIASASWPYLILTQRHFMLLAQSESSF